MKDLNRFARQEIVREFPFLANLPISLQFNQVNEFSVRRLDEGLFRSRAQEISWHEHGDSLHDDVNFHIVNEGRFVDKVPVGLMVAEVLKELPDFILEIRYRDFSRSDYSLELILWKRPKDNQLLEVVILRLRDEAKNELRAEISAVDL